MKCNWLRWLWGLLPLGALIAFTYTSTHEGIQADLKSRTEAALRSAGLNWANTGFAGRDGHVAGRAYAEGDQLQALNVVRRVWGVRVADDRSSLIERAETYLWGATRDSDRVRLTGFVPNSQIRETIVKAARYSFPQARVVDEMKPARGAPEQGVWIPGISFGLQQLARLQPGAQINLRDAAFSIAGKAATLNDYRTVSDAVAQDLPSGIQLAQANVEPPVVSPYSWAASHDGRVVTLSGHAPGETERDNLLNAAKQAFPSAAIVDRMAIGAGAPTGFVSAGSTALRELARLKSGEASLSDQTMSFSGLAVREETALAVGRDLTSALPAGFKVDPEVQFEQPLIPIARPYRTNVTVSDGSVTISGNVPSAAQRQALLDQAASTFPGLRVVDELQIARGEPTGWAACTMQSITALGRLGNGRAAMLDDRLIVSGKTDDEALAKALPDDLRAATNRICRARANVALELPPEPDLEWRADVTTDTVVLTGEVPDSDTRDALVTRAQTLFPNATVRDEMRVKPARGERWRRAAIAGLEALARLRSGSARLRRQNLTVVGEARDAAAVTGVRQRLKALPTAYSGSDDLNIKSDAMIWAEREARRRDDDDQRRRIEEARKREEQRLAALARERAKARERARRAAEERARQEAEERARREAEERRRAEEAERARLAEEARRKADAEAAERQRVAEEARRKAEAEAAELRRQEAEARRRARERAEEERRRQIEAARLAEERRLQRAEAARLRCQRALDQIRTTGRINFALASADIQARSFGLLDRLAEATQTCDNVLIDIEGHTDSQGTEANNLSLSQRRAQSVVDYLVSAGVPRDRLIARGYGESRPLVPNTTASNRARNRRIEFVVRLQ